MGFIHFYFYVVFILAYSDIPVNPLVSFIKATYALTENENALKNNPAYAEHLERHPLLGTYKRNTNLEYRILDTTGVEITITLDNTMDITHIDNLEKIPDTGYTILKPETIKKILDGLDQNNPFKFTIRCTIGRLQVSTCVSNSLITEYLNILRLKELKLVGNNSMSHSRPSYTRMCEESEYTHSFLIRATKIPVINENNHLSRRLLVQTYNVDGTSRIRSNYFSPGMKIDLIEIDTDDHYLGDLYARYEEPELKLEDPGMFTKLFSQIRKIVGGT